MRWNLDHLRFFLALARHRKLTLAASAVGASHSTVLRRVRTLERDLETRLFEKTPNGFVLTASGTRLRVAVETIDGAMDSISRQITGSDKRVEGKVVISTSDTLGYRVLPRAINRLKTAYPGLEIDLRVNNSMADISAGEADIAVRASRHPPPGLVGRRVGMVPFAACAARSYLARRDATAFPKDTSTHQFICYDDSFAKAPFQRWLARRLAPGDDITVTNGVMAALELCRAGLGIAVLPRYLTDDDDELVNLPGRPAIPTNELWILTHKDLHDSARIRTTNAFLRDELRLIFSQ